MGVSFDLSTVFRTVAETLPDQKVFIWRDRRLTYSQMDARIDGVARYLAAQGLGCHVERADLAGHQSGQDHLGLYLRNGNEYLEAQYGAFKMRGVSVNVNYRYLDDEEIAAVEGDRRKKDKKGAAPEWTGGALPAPVLPMLGAEAWGVIVAGVGGTGGLMWENTQRDWEWVLGALRPANLLHVQTEVDLKTGAYDYGEPGGPGHADCVRNCKNGMAACPEDDDE